MSVAPTSPQWLSDDEQRVWRQLLHMTTRLDAALNRDLQRTCGLSRADYDVLVVLSEADDGRRRTFQLVEDLQWEQSRLSHHVARMERRGLVRRDDCPTDRRGAYVVLTDAGRAAIEGAAPEHAATVRRLVFDRVDAGELATVGAFVARVSARLDADAVGS